MPTEKPKAKPGRKTKLTPERQTKILNAIRAGAYMETAAAAAGVNKETLYAWLKRGNVEPESIFGAFVEAVHEAQASAELRDVLTLSKAAADGDWRAAAWRLERKFPKRWGLTTKTELSGPNGGPVVTSSVDVTKLTDEQLAAIVNRRRPVPGSDSGA